MPGAQDRWDQLAEQAARNPEVPTQPDARWTTDRPERGSLGDFRLRLERLPPGHPSSPYNDDLSRKPPAVRLKDLELPLHAGERDANGATPRHEDPHLEAGPVAETTARTSHNGSAGLTGLSSGGWSSAATTPGAGDAAGLGDLDDRLTADGPVTPDDPVTPEEPLGLKDLPSRPDSFGLPDLSSPPEPLAVTDPPGSAASFGLPDLSSPAEPLAVTDPPGPPNSFGRPGLPGPQESFALRDLPSREEAFGADEPFGSDQPASWDEPAGWDGEASADEGAGTILWSSTDQLAGAEDETGAAVWGNSAGEVSADDEAGAWPGADHLTSTDDDNGSDPADAARWSGPDDLSSTAEWNRTTTGWSSPPGWDPPPGGDDTINPAWPEPGHANGATSPAAAGSDGRGGEPRLGRDGSWEWNGRYLSREEGLIADEALTRCRTAEGRNVFGSYGHSGLTPAMRRLEAQLERGRLLPDTEGYALKPPDLFRERLADLIQRHPDKSADELSREIHDAIRYAYIFEAEDYADATLQVHSRLKGQGFELEARRNSWRSPEYKGINTRWRDPAHDAVFEVEFHTAPSWEAKRRAQASYEQVVNPATSPGQRARLRAAHAEASAAVPVPPRCMAIPDYRKEGL